MGNRSWVELFVMAAVATAAVKTARAAPPPTPAPAPAPTSASAPVPTQASTARREHTRALATRLLDAVKQPSPAKLMTLLETLLRYSLGFWNDKACDKQFHDAGTVTRATLPAFVACLSKQSFSMPLLVEDEPDDKTAHSYYLHVTAAPTGRRLINAIELEVVFERRETARFTGIRGAGAELSRPGGQPTSGSGARATDPIGPRPVRIAFSAPSGEFGNLSADEIDRVVKSRAGVFRACYQKELNHTPGISGKLVIYFEIDDEGLVQAARTMTAPGSTLHNDPVEQCVRNNVNRLRFPAKGSVAQVNYPFVYSQGE